MPVNVSFKVSGAGGSSFSLDLEPSLTVAEVKQLAKEKASIEPERMKIIFKGRILKDTETLESQNVESGCTMHVVRSVPSSSPAPAAVPAATATTPATPSEGGYAATTPVASPAATTVPGAPMSGAPATDPLAATLGAGGLGAPSGASANPMAAMMNDPSMMQAAMQMLGGGGMGGTAGVPGTPGAGGIPGPGASGHYAHAAGYGRCWYGSPRWCPGDAFARRSGRWTRRRSRRRASSISRSRCHASCHAGIDGRTDGSRNRGARRCASEFGCNVGRR
eukprot:TRINITY_DN3657_c0_g1_i2.p1 TRINITY_DN3657_c0_g1~~TRINITY_DN3657_c0_g1_i2.p1  ORF type:complete len:285 (+),score=48.55 TRINITY_DN3657_c0_g1_i2:23-856(+)